MECICISHWGVSTDGANLLCRAETRLVLTRVEPGQDTLSESLQLQQGVWMEPVCLGLTNKNEAEVKMSGSESPCVFNVTVFAWLVQKSEIKIEC